MSIRVSPELATPHIAPGLCAPAPGRLLSWSAILCALFGHEVDGRTRTYCRCGAAILAEDPTETRIRHNVTCFLSGHDYVPVGERHGHREYACVACGHPLLFEVGRDPYADCSRYRKRVRYFCKLFGHRVHAVVDRADKTEYACFCGHTFLRSERGATTVRHPPLCLFAGHFVRFVERRAGHAEYVCRRCGHTFAFSVGSLGAVSDGT